MDAALALPGRHAVSPGVDGSADWMGPAGFAGRQRDRDCRGPGGRGRSEYGRRVVRFFPDHGAAAGMRLPGGAQPHTVFAPVWHGALPGVAEQCAGVVFGRGGIFAGHAADQPGDGGNGPASLPHDAGPLHPDSLYGRSANGRGAAGPYPAGVAGRVAAAAFVAFGVDQPVLSAGLLPQAQARADAGGGARRTLRVRHAHAHAFCPRDSRYPGKRYGNGDHGHGS